MSEKLKTTINSLNQRIIEQDKRHSFLEEEIKDREKEYNDLRTSCEIIRDERDSCRKQHNDCEGTIDPLLKTNNALSAAVPQVTVQLETLAAQICRGTIKAGQMSTFEENIKKLQEQLLDLTQYCTSSLMWRFEYSRKDLSQAGSLPDIVAVHRISNNKYQCHLTK